MRLNSFALLNKICSLAPVIALTCSLPIVFAAHSYFSFGVWYRAEPVIVMFHATSAMCSLALIFSWWHDRMKFIEVMSHPFILILIALCIWIAITAPFAQFPLLSLLGSPQLGEGALWYANLAVLIACGLYVVREKRQWRFLVIWAVVTAWGIVAIKISAAAQGTYELIWIGAYLAYIGLALPLLGLKALEGRWRWFWLFNLGACISIIMIAESKAAMAFLAFGMGLVGVAALIKPTTQIGQFLRDRRPAMIIAGLVAVVPLIAIANGMLNDIPSLYSRFLVSKLMNEALSAESVSWLFGQGWGRTQDALVANLQVAGENLWQRRWDYFSGDYIHSHNWILEALYACGIPGVILTLLFYLSIPYVAEPEKRFIATGFVAAYAGMNAVWFQVSFSLPYIALALAVLGSAWQIKKETFKKFYAFNPIGLILLVVLLFSQITAALSLQSFGVQSSKAAMSYKEPPLSLTRIQYPKDFRKAEHGFALAIREHLAWLKKDAALKNESIVINQQVVSRFIIQDLKERIPVTESPYLILAGVALFSDLVYDPKLKWLRFNLSNEEELLWNEWVKKLLALAHGRTDTAIPYFAWLLSQNKISILTDYTKSILEIDSNDPIALYFQGAALLLSSQDSARMRGFKYLNKSIENGVERFMPLDLNFKKKILKVK